MKERVYFPAEWYPQSGVLITWPHEGTDWVDMLDEVVACYVTFSKEILKRQKLVVVCADPDEVLPHFTLREQENLVLKKIKSNDTWTRDHGGIAVFRDGQPWVCDFGFNGWGLKYPAYWDNLITMNLFRHHAFQPQVKHRNELNFILEGGSIETDGQGTILTTTRCLYSLNRNGEYTKFEIEQHLGKTLGAKRVLWLNHGYLMGDDTDGHIDTLARFCDENTIAYVQCLDQDDPHFEDLGAMEEELKKLVTTEGKPYRLIPLPMAKACYWDEVRLPATYANFLIINGAVLIPFYGSEIDEQAREQLQVAFPHREVIGVDCFPLITQRGSLHCVTMQYPEGFF